MYPDIMEMGNSHWINIIKWPVFHRIWLETTISTLHIMDKGSFLETSSVTITNNWPNQDQAHTHMHILSPGGYPV